MAGGELVGEMVGVTALVGVTVGRGGAGSGEQAARSNTTKNRGRMRCRMVLSIPGKEPAAAMEPSYLPGKVISIKLFPLLWL